MGTSGRHEIAALQVKQWLPAWDEVRFSRDERRSRPPEHFYLCSMSAPLLRRLAGIERRSVEAGTPRFADEGIQRRHDPDRSAEIRQFVQHGFPWSDLRRQQRRSGKFDDLKMPGWLPTAVVVNIRQDLDDESRAVTVQEREVGAAVLIPDNALTAGWDADAEAPIHIIDGQHRLWAFESDDPAEYELPVVAFVGLDVTWRAYLFYTINIKPKRINTSLAFDLYPLLRTEEWLQRFEGPSIYREARAQELTEALWAHPASPWFQRINMLGERGKTGVSQAAWIRSLTSTLIRAYEGRGVRGVGGLFGAPVGGDQLVLPWSRSQQAAYVIHFWRSLFDSIRTLSPQWAEELRSLSERSESSSETESFEYDPAVHGRHALLNTDQGVRAALYALNDFGYELVDKYEMYNWFLDSVDEELDLQDVDLALDSLTSRSDMNWFIDELTNIVATFDWRTAAAPNLSESLRTEKMAFKGSSGYREVRRRLFIHISESNSELGAVAQDLLDKLDLV